MSAPVPTTSTGRQTDLPRRIVVGVDGSEEADAALDWAARLAGRTGACLEIVTSFGPEYAFVSPDEARLACDDLLETRAGRVAGIDPEVTVTTKAAQGSVDRILVSESTRADLLVVGSRGLGGFRGLLLGSVGRKCVHGASCPVVVVRGSGPDTADDEAGPESNGGASPDWPDEEEAGAVHRVVVGYDGSPSSVAVLQWAAADAERTGARLEVLMAWEWPVSYGWSTATSEYDPGQDCETQLDRALEPVRRAHPDLPIQSVTIEGSPASLLAKASHGADLVAVGSRGHGEAAGLLLGSVSEYVVIHARCPVLVYHQAS